MNTSPAPTTRRRLSRITARVAAVVTATMLAGALSGCGVRLETPPPAEPVPDAAELLRRTAVSDALGVKELAESALTAPDLPEDVAGELSRISSTALEHSDALGGEYDSGIEREPEVDELLPSPLAEEEPPPAAPADVVAALSDAAGRNRTAAGTAADGEMARLLTSIGASQTVSATRLAALVGEDGPNPPAVVVPPPAPQEEPSPDPSPVPTRDPDVVATTAPGAEDVVPPAGISAAEYQAVIVAEDGTRYALEVLAARTGGDERAALVAAARVHGERAQAWAVLAGVAGTSQDPRAVAYTVPRDEEAAVIVQSLASAHAVNYASLVAHAAPSTRGVLVDLVVDAALTLQRWGAEPTAFPGFP